MPLAGQKTVPTSTDIDTFIADVRQRADAQTLVELLGRMTGEPPVLWGSMVDFGRYHYKYASGREGDALPYRLFAAQERVQHLTELSRCAGECRGACRPVRLRSQAPLGRACPLRQAAHRCRPQRAGGSDPHIDRDDRKDVSRHIKRATPHLCRRGPEWEEVRRAVEGLGDKRRTELPSFTGAWVACLASELH